MKTIAEAISDLLYVRDTVVVPGLGAFVKKPVSAQVNRVANYFTAPSCVVEFDDDLREDNDLIVNYIAGENDIPDDEARRLLAIFVSDCFNNLKEGKKVTLNGIGTLRYDWHSDIVLEQDASSNFNSDAFGLTDFTATPVVHSVTKDEIKAEIEKQQWEKNTPVTVDEKAVHEEDEVDVPRRRVWPWVLLVLLLLAGLVFGLQYFRIVDFRDWFKPQPSVVLPADTVKEPEKPVEPEPVKTDSTARPAADTLTQNDTVQPVEEPQAEVAEPVQNIEPLVEEVKPAEEEAKILIVAGCFSVEDYAVNMMNKLKSQGYQSALVEKHGDKWFVAYGRYHTTDEAEEAYKQIKANDSGAKAWIRK